MVDIFVGPNQKKFHLHHDLVCHRSNYFRACFAGNFKEAQQKKIYLPEDDVESFDLLVGWLYGAPLKKISSKDDLPVYFALAVAADKFCLEHLFNETMDNILRFHRTFPVFIDYQVLSYVFHNIPGEHPILRFLVNFAVWMTVSTQSALLCHGLKFSLSKECKDLIWEGGYLAVYFTGMLTAVNARTKGNREVIARLDPRRWSNCYFHRHNFTPTCSQPAQ